MRDLEKLKEEVREAFLENFDKTTSFAICRCTREEKLKLLEDYDFNSELDSLKGKLYSNDIKAYDKLIEACMATPEVPKDVDGDIAKLTKKLENETLLKNAPVLIKALEKRQDLLFSQMNLNANEERALNIVYYAITKEEFENMDNVEVYSTEGSEDTDASFKQEENDSFEAKQKKKIKKALADMKQEEEKNGSHQETT